MKIDSDLLQVEETSYVEPIEINMVKITEDFDMEVEDEALEGSENQIEGFYPKANEGLFDFLH